MALVSQIETADAVRPQLVAMEHACAGDAVIMAAVTMIKTIEEQRAALPKAPSDPVGVPSVLQIQRRFQVVRQASWREILVPSGLRTIEGHLLGRLFSAFRLPSSTSGGGGIAQEDRLVKASDLVRAGELGKAVALLESLEGPAAEPFRDWLVDARHRLVANQAGSLVRARVSLLLFISLYNPRFSPEWCVLKRDDVMTRWPYRSAFSPRGKTRNQPTATDQAISDARKRPQRSEGVHSTASFQRLVSPRAV